MILQTNDEYTWFWNVSMLRLRTSASHCQTKHCTSQHQVYQAPALLYCKPDQTGMVLTT